MKDFKLGEILNLLYSKRRLIILVTVIFTLLGFLVALTSPTEWRASNTLVTMSKSGSSIPSSLGKVYSQGECVAILDFTSKDIHKTSKNIKKKKEENIDKANIMLQEKIKKLKS
mgnify:CR=1 FL=1